MTPEPERISRPDHRPPALPRTVLLAGVALLAAGWVAGLVGGETSGRLVRLLVDMGLAAVVSVPILNVVAVMTVEWQRRHTAFAAAAAAVLAMLAVNVLWRG